MNKIEFFKPEDFNIGLLRGRMLRKVADRANRLLSERREELFEALGMKRVYFTKDDHMCLYDKRYDFGELTWHNLEPDDTHTFWMTKPEPIEKEKACDHIMKLAFGYCETDIECDAQAHFDYCPQCGEKLGGE